MPLPPAAALSPGLLHTLGWAMDLTLLFDLTLWWAAGLCPHLLRPPESCRGRVPQMTGYIPWQPPGVHCEDAVVQLGFSSVGFNPRPPVCSFPAPGTGESSAVRDAQSGSTERGLSGATTSRPRGSHHLRHLLHVGETGMLGHPESVPEAGGRGRSQRGWPALWGDAVGREASSQGLAAGVLTLLPTLSGTHHPIPVPILLLLSETHHLRP